MNESATWYVKAEGGQVYGPATIDSLVQWAKDGRVQPTSFLSQDRLSWIPAQTKPELEMKWLIEPEPGKVFGPFNRALVIRLSKEGTLSEQAKVYQLHELPPDQDPPPQIVEKIVEKEVRVEVPVEKIVEKIVEKEVRVEVPVEKIVEKEVRVEVPVEKIVEKEVPVEKIVEKIVEKEVRVEVPVEKIVVKEVPVEKIVEKVVVKEVLVEPSARTEVVVPEVVDPVDREPPPSSMSNIFGNLNRNRLAALEAAARRELASCKKKGFSMNIFGGKAK